MREYLPRSFLLPIIKTNKAAKNKSRPVRFLFVIMTFTHMSLPFTKEIEELLAKNNKQVLVMGENGPLLADLELSEKNTGGREAILVTGGMGYIGSHTVRELMARGKDVVVLDNLSGGHKAPLEVKLVEGDLSDPIILDKVFSESNITAVVHFAGSIRVDESVREPEKYFRNNVVTSMNLANAMLAHGVKNIVYSSSAAVYGNPAKIPIKEEDEKVPTNPYGETKLMVEKIFGNYHVQHGLNSVALRYFNAAGASLDAMLGENHAVETHIIPKILDVVLRKESAFKVFGNDYPTRDGTAVRDYVHVLDLAAVHILALEKLSQTPGLYAYNVGTGKGYSIMQVIQEVLEVTRRMVICEPQPRREGDPAILVADSTKLKNELGYELKYSDLKTIITTAWEWHKKLNS
ncbi:MAG TPA: UDP-glucose 4-epimerase GalE [Chitinophagaceae bacterium]|nr:UDP-glucose 4-epimerase GalE [Chitinophagaceae bacterium]